jgi:tetratricopeptide (TPR) repeat protein
VTAVLPRRAVVALALALVVAPVSVQGDDGATTRHLLAGVHAFKDGRYEEALVELRVVARAADAPADLAFYLGPTLYKLGRYDEALAVFVASKVPADPLTDFYLGETYYQLRLFRKARAVFAGLRTRGLGPVLDAAAERYVAAVDAAYEARPAPDAIDYYADAGAELVATDPIVAGEYLDEARQVEALGEPHRHAEIAGALGAVWNAADRPRAVIAALAADPARGDEATWQLARADLAVGDAVAALPLVMAIAAGGGPHAAAATGVLSRSR